MVVLLLVVLQGAPGARQACSIQPVVRLGGTTSFGVSRHPSISADGRFVAFESDAEEFDGDFTTDVFVYDRLTCALELVSVSSTGVKGNVGSDSPSISDDGRFVAFTSNASNLVASDVNSFSADAFVRDRLLGLTTLVSVSSSEEQPATDSASVVKISRNGQFVAFISVATTLVPGDTNNEADLFVRDLVGGTTERVSISTSGQQGDSPYSVGVWDPVLSDDGRFVAFASVMNTLVADDFNDSDDIFVRDRLANTTVRASLDANGAEVPFTSFWAPAMTGDGRFVFFSSFDNLVPGNPACDGIFIRDLTLSTTSCPALDPADVNPWQSAERPAISSDGRYVAFASRESYYVPGDTGFEMDVFVHDRLTGSTQRATVSASGAPANDFTDEAFDLSADGQVVAFASAASNLVPFDTNDATDVFAVIWTMVSAPPDVNLMRNGSFASALEQWLTFATPDPSHLVTDTTAGELRFYRVPPPPGAVNQAVVFQQTWAQLVPHAPIEARFRLGNSSSVRKRISVLIHDADFSDLSVCTFWLEAGAPVRQYLMRSHTTESWSNATISFYAATAGSDGGFYRLDDVSLVYAPLLDDDVTDCVDPTAPVAPGGAPGPTLLTNGDFAAGLSPWTTFGQITWQIVNGVFEFFRPPGLPAGVVLQATGQPLSQNAIVTATLYVGNSSSVRKRVTVILHDQDFSDLSACTFWLPPNLALSPFYMRTFTTKVWASATFSVYPATADTAQWIRFTDAVLQVTPGTTPLGTECLEPGADAIVLPDRGLERPTRAGRR